MADVILGVCLIAAVLLGAVEAIDKYLEDEDDGN